MDDMIVVARISRGWPERQKGGGKEGGIVVVIMVVPSWCMTLAKWLVGLGEIKKDNCENL